MTTDLIVDLLIDVAEPDRHVDSPERQAAWDEIKRRDAELTLIKRTLAAMADEHTDDLFWHNSDPTKDAGLFVLCNDVFFWGSADGETVTADNIETLEQAMKDGGRDGAWLFVARVRGERPQGAAYSYIEAERWPLFDAAGPERETGMGNPCKPGEYVRPVRRDRPAKIEQAARDLLNRPSDVDRQEALRTALDDHGLESLDH